MQIDLTQKETGMLRGLLEADLADLRMEIAGTESLEFRESLERRERFVNDLLARLAHSAPSNPHT